MAAGRTFHWKHGWVPLTAWAKKVADGKDAGPRPGGDEARRARYNAAQNRDVMKTDARRKRYEAHQAENAAEEAARRARYNAAQARKADKNAGQVAQRVWRRPSQ